MDVSFLELKSFLDQKYAEFNTPRFIESDPIQIPYAFSKKEDIEISGFLTASIAWGQRKTIILNAQRLISMMDHDPYSFILNASDTEINALANFKHRTFNGVDVAFFIKSLRNIYLNHNGLEHVFNSKSSAFDRICTFRTIFLEVPHLDRSNKHISNPEKNSACKRIHMFLRWMVRPSLDFNIWTSIHPNSLYCPLDVHSGNVARKLSLLKRPQNDWKAVEELTQNLRILDKQDPIKYDLVLFGLGAFENFR